MLSTKYIIETIRIKEWKNFLHHSVAAITKILMLHNNQIQKYKLEQKILNYNTYLLGKHKLSSYVVFPKKKSILKYKTIFHEDIAHNWVVGDIDKIISTYININHECKRDMKSQVGLLGDVALEVHVKKGRDVELSIDGKKFSLSKNHYTRLQKMFRGENEDVDMMICILLVRYEYYGTLKEGICLSTSDVYNFITSNGLGDMTLEAFAGTLNSNLPNYCSLFYDVEGSFGSQGSFLTMSVKECDYQVIISNPPYITNVMNDSSHKLLQFLGTCDGVVIVIIPDWRSVTEYGHDKQNQISINEHEQTRENVAYTSYKLLRDSKYFRNVMCVGNYMYYNFFANSTKKIRDNVLFVALSSQQNVMINNFFDYMTKVVM